MRKVAWENCINFRFHKTSFVLIFHWIWKEIKIFDDMNSFMHEIEADTCEKLSKVNKLIYFFSKFDLVSDGTKWDLLYYHLNIQMWWKMGLLKRVLFQHVQLDLHLQEKISCQVMIVS